MRKVNRFDIPNKFPHHSFEDNKNIHEWDKSFVPKINHQLNNGI